MKRGKKPVGVTVFGILQIVFGALSVITMFFAFIAMILIYNIPEFQELVTAGEMNVPYTIFSAIMSSVIGAIGIVSGIGVLILKSWARKLLMGLAIFVILFGIVNLIMVYTLEMGFWNTLLGYVIGAVYYGLILWYFNRKHVKAAFTRKV